MQPVTQHYDKAYYESHYDAFLKDESYAQAVARFYRLAIFDQLGLTPDDRVLDFGSGPGQLTLGLKADCFDPSEYIQEHLRKTNRRVYPSLTDAPRGAYRAVFSSHSLEHCFNPGDELKEIASLLAEKGLLILILPKEQVPGRPTSRVDNDRHLYSWNFQLITNLLSATGYRVLRQRVFHAPFGLRTLTRRLSVDTAAKWALRLGQWKGHYPALLTIAEKAA